MSNDTKVSILVHNINRASVLAPCLQSILQQEYRPLEVVILDAGSTDESPNIIASMSDLLVSAGIDVQVHNCAMMGVAASRNLAARLATGQVICPLDNDATFDSSDAITQAASILQNSPRCALIAFRVLNGSTEQIDRTTWVYRRSEGWANRRFRTFTFAGGAFCARTEAFWKNGGFWEALTYSREEEDLGFALIDDGWQIIYSPEIVVRHYSDPRGRYSLIQRKRVELRNGLLVLWRRVPLPLLPLACSARIGTMFCGALTRGYGITELLKAVPDAIRTWRQARLVRSPISLSAAGRYVALHFVGVPCDK